MSSVEISARKKGELGNLVPSIHLMQFRLVSCDDTTHAGAPEAYSSVQH